MLLFLSLVFLMCFPHAQYVFFFNLSYVYFANFFFKSIYVELTLKWIDKGIKSKKFLKQFSKPVGALKKTQIKFVAIKSVLLWTDKIYK